MADVTRDVVARLKVETDGDTQAVKQVADDIGALPQSAADATAALEAFGAMLADAAKSGEDLGQLKEEINAVVAAAAEFNMADGAEQQEAALAKLRAAWDVFGTKAKETFKSVEQAQQAYTAGLDVITTKQQQLTASLEQTAQASSRNASALRDTGSNAAWVAEQTALIMGSAEKASAAGLKYGESFAAAAKSTDSFGASAGAATGFLQALLLKVDPVGAAIGQLRVVSELAIKTTETLADVTGIQLPASFSKAASAGTELAISIAKLDFEKASHWLREYINWHKEYVAETLASISATSKLNEQVVEGNAKARGSLQEVLKAQREMVDARKEEGKALELQSAVLERQIKAEQEAGRVTKQTADATQELLDKYEEIGEKAPAGFEAAAKAAGVLSTAEERAAEKADRLAAAAGEDGAAGALDDLGESATAAADPLASFAQNADMARDALSKAFEEKNAKSLDELGESATEAGSAVGGAAAAVGEFRDTVSESGTVVDKFVDSAGERLTQFADDVGERFDSLAESVGNAFDQITENAQRSNDALFDPYNKKGDPARDSPGAAVEGPTGGRDSARDDAKGQREALEAAREAADQIKEAVAEAKAGIEQLVQAAQSATAELPALAEALGNVAIAIGQVAGNGDGGGGIARIKEDLSGLAEIEFASGIVSQLESVTAAADAAAAAIASIPAAAGDDEAPSAPVSGPSGESH